MTAETRAQPGLPSSSTVLDLAPTELLVGGEHRLASDGSRFEVFDPATARVLTSVASGTPQDAVDAVDAAQRARPAWSATAPRERAEVLRRAFELLVAETEGLARLISLENGKALADARTEIRYAAEFFRWYSEEAVRILGSVATAPSGANRILVVRQPIGVAVLVTPWNFPAAMATRKIAPALAAGCSVVLKPASDTPLTALAIARILAKAGVPDGVLNVVPSRRSGPVVSAMLAHPATRKVSFTGSTEVGRTLLHTAADRVLSTSIELGGNAPFLVLADADLEAAVAGAMLAKMRNGGEACTSANRFLVHSSVAARFAELFAEAMRGLRQGPGINEDTQLGPLINSEAVDTVDRLVTDAIDRGARVVTGGTRHTGEGWFYPATVLDDVSRAAALLDEEIFGPVAPIVRFDDIDDAIALANDTELGLVSYLYTGDLATGLRVSEALEAGMVGLNRGLVSDPAAPFGGVKQSGLGREGGHEGLLEYTETKYIATDW